MAKNYREYVNDGIKYKEKADGTFDVVYFDNSRGVLEIPSIVLGREVTGIAEKAFYRKTKLKEIVLPKTLRTISAGAFFNCMNLKNVKILSDEVMIKSNAFQNCFQLEEFDARIMHIPEKSTFEDCRSLREIRGVFYNVVGPRTFAKCKRLEKVDLADNISVSYEAFYGCTSLTNILFRHHAILAEDVLKFVKKRTITCFRGSMFAEWAYEGTPVIFYEEFF